MKKLTIFLLITLLMIAGCVYIPDNITIKYQDDFTLEKTEGGYEIIAGATQASQTFTFGSTPDITFDTNTYILLWDDATGDLADADAGTVAAATTWEDAAIATAAHTINTEVWVATIPALDTDYTYSMTIWSGTSYNNTDTLQSGPWYYDPITNKAFTGNNPIWRDAVLTIGKPHSDDDYVLRK